MGAFSCTEGAKHGVAIGKYKYWISKKGLTKIKGWAKDGLTDIQIATNMNISSATLYKWKNTYTEIVEAIKEGREKPVSNLENAMYSAAVGGVIQVRKGMKVKEVYYDDEGHRCEREKVETYVEDNYIRPDTTAGIFLLKHWAKGYTTDPMQLELKKKELQLKEKQIDSKEW